MRKKEGGTYLNVFWGLNPGPESNVVLLHVQMWNSTQHSNHQTTIVKFNCVIKMKKLNLLSHCCNHEGRSDLIRSLHSQSCDKCFNLEGRIEAESVCVSVQLVSQEGQNTIALKLCPYFKNNRSEFPWIFLKCNFVHQLDCLPTPKPSSRTQLISQDKKGQKTGQRLND